MCVVMASAGYTGITPRARSSTVWAFAPWRTPTSFHAGNPREVDVSLPRGQGAWGDRLGCGQEEAEAGAPTRRGSHPLDGRALSARHGRKGLAAAEMGSA